MHNLSKTKSWNRDLKSSESQDGDMGDISSNSDNFHLPISIRKGVRSCTTKHPIDIVSYEDLSPSYRAFVLASSDEIPQNIHKATKQSEK